MIRLDAATVLLQWSVGGLFFLWVTTRRRIAGIGYGWLLRSVYLVMALGAVAAGVVIGADGWREAVSAAVAVAAGVALASSIARRRAGVSGERAVEERRSERVAAMTGIDRDTKLVDHSGTEFDPRMDLVAPAIGVIGLVLAAIADGGPHGLAIARTLVGAALFGAVTDAMLLGHWYLVQPGLGRGLLNELVRLLAWIWPFEVAAMLWPTGMIQVLDGTIKDGYGGLLGWFWVACAVTTIILCVVTRAALKERYYSAVMAATGFLYLTILTGFGTDLVARALVARGGI